MKVIELKYKLFSGTETEGRGIRELNKEVETFLNEHNIINIDRKVVAKSIAGSWGDGGGYVVSHNYIITYE